MKAFRALFSITALLVTNLALAHTDVSSTTPKSGSELNESPPTIEIRFHEGAKMTSLVVVGADKKERKLEFVASDKPNTYVVKEPKLATGRNEVQWKALSNDGHVATGKLLFTIRASVKAN